MTPRDAIIAALALAGGAPAVAQALNAALLLTQEPAVIYSFPLNTARIVADEVQYTGGLLCQQ